MDEITPGQRWVSHTEPELGLGLILEVASQRVTVVFLACQEKRTYALDNAPLTRVIFSPGEKIESIAHCKLTVNKLVEHAGIISYICVAENGEEIQLEEVELDHHIQFNKPQDRLFAGLIDPEDWFLLRHQTWQNLQRLQQTPVRGLIAGRTSLIAHQLYIAHEAASRVAPRVMLADEVGLGKTIEAGLILQHRLINGLSQRVLIIVPETLLHQWLVEMIRRFNLNFSIFDESRCQDAVDENPFLAEQQILSSQEFFFNNRIRQEQVLSCEWDLVIIDEAHHIQWDQQAPSPEYQFIAKLSRQTAGLILLTATPEQMGKQSHFARLSLLDPDRFFSYQQFLEEEKTFAPVAKAANLLLKQQSLDAELQSSLNNLLKHDHVEALLAKLAKASDTQSVREQLLNILLDHHGTGRILFRNSRQTVQGFPKRQRHSYPLDVSHNTCDETHTQIHHSSQDVRFSWLLEKINDLGDQKALLICHQAKLAIELSRDIKKTTGILIPVFHEGMTILERDRAAAWFADEENKVPLLVCSEIGSEGRNFQFVHHLILFDLPVNPDLLQQRIGRLDRIGQQHDIQIHIPYLKGSADEVLFRWYDEGMDIFHANSSAASLLYEIQKNRLQDLLQDWQSEKLQEFIEETVKLRSEIEHELQQGRDQLLELNSCRQDISQSLIDEIHKFSQGPELWQYMEALAECYGVETEFHSQDCYILKPGQHMRISHFPELAEDGMTVTVKRDLALAREDMQFLSWEHPMMIAAMEMVIASETGNAAVSIVKHSALSSGQFLLEMLYIVECSAPAELQIGRFLPATPIRILIDQNKRDLSDVITQSSFTASNEKIEPVQIAEFFSAQKELLHTILEVAQHKAEQLMRPLINQSNKEMLETLGKELKRLVRLKQSNPAIKQAEIDLMADKIHQTHENIQAAQLKLDAVRFIIVS